MYTGAGIFNAARRASQDPTVVSQFIASRRGAEEAPPVAAPPPKVPPLVAAVMRGNAQIQSVKREKDTQETMATVLSRMKITEHGDGTIDVKGAPPEFFEGKSLAAESEVSIAEPHAKVNKALTTEAQTPPPVIPPASVARPEEVQALEVMYTANDAVWGQRLPRPYEVDEMLKTPDGIRRLTLLLGGTEQHVRTNIAKIGQGNNREIARTNFVKRLVALHSDLYETHRPALNESQQNTRANLQAVQETRRVVNSFLDNRIDGYATADDAVATIKQHVTDSGLPWNAAIEKEARAEYAAKTRKVRTEAEKVVYDRISKIKDEDVKGYGGDFGQWLANTEGSLGVTFNDAQRKAAEARFAGVTKEVKAAEDKVERQRVKEETRAALAAITEARRVAAEERRVALDARKLQKETTSEQRTQRKEQDAQIKAAEDDLAKLDSELRKLNLAYAKSEGDQTVSDAERAEMRRQAAMLVAKIPELQNRLYDALGVITQEEWDELLKMGNTPEEISATGVRAIRKRKK